MGISRIMVVDDDPDDRDLFAAAASQTAAPVAVRFASDGLDALQQLKSDAGSDIELLLLDVNMPAMDGWETLTRLKRNVSLREIPVIMFSTSSASSDIEKAARLGAVAFISKPSCFDHIIQLVRMITALPDGNAAKTLHGYAPMANQ